MIPACLLRTNWSELHSNDDNCPLDWRGVPGASLIAFGVLILGIIQIGPSVILISVIIWSWMTMETPTALIFTVYMIPVNLIDNVLRPIIFAPEDTDAGDHCRRHWRHAFEWNHRPVCRSDRAGRRLGFISRFRA
jgi:hypothetical protein